MQNLAISTICLSFPFVCLYIALKCIPTTVATASLSRNGAHVYLIISYLTSCQVNSHLHCHDDVPYSGGTIQIVHIMWNRNANDFYPIL